MYPALLSAWSEKRIMMAELFPFGANAMAKKTTAKKPASDKPSIAEQARAYRKANPKATTQEIADHLKTSYNNVYQAFKKKGGKKKKLGRKAGKASRNGHAPASMHGALDTAFDFVQKVGGLVHAETLIEKLKAFKAKL
jgi:hypothetical protein